MSARENAGQHATLPVSSLLGHRPLGETPSAAMSNTGEPCAKGSAQAERAGFTGGAPDA